MKKIIILLFLLQTFTLKAQLSGSGTVGDPYLIGNVSDLKYFRDQINLTDGNVYETEGKYFKLTANLDMSGEVVNWVSIGNNPNVANNFKGIFDGDNKTISNLKIGTSGARAYQNPNSGLFGTISNSGQVKNLRLEGISYYLNRTSAGTFMVGGLAAQITAGVKIVNCHVTGIINAINADNTNAADMVIGGLVGKIQRGPDVSPASDLVQIINSSSNVTVTALSTSTLTGDVVYAGGLVALYAATSFTNTPEMINCYSKGSVSGQSTIDNTGDRDAQKVFVAGIWGYNCGKLYNCYASGQLSGTTVSAHLNVCGITGFLNTGTLTNCFAIMDAINTSTTNGGTVIARRIANGVGTPPQIISVYSYASTLINAGVVNTLNTSTEPNGLDITSTDFINGLNDYVTANPTNNGVSLKNWAAITVSSNDLALGTVSASSTVLVGQQMSLVATPIGGNVFVNWTVDGDEVSRSATYTYTTTATKTIIANFIASSNINVTDVAGGSGVDYTLIGGTLTINGAKTFRDLTINSGAKLILSNTNTLTIERDLIIKASKISSPTLTVGTAPSITIGGDLKFKKTFDIAQWYFMSFPSTVTIADIVQSAGARNTNWWIKQYNGSQRASNGGSSSNWENVPDATLTARKGYIFGLADALGSGNFEFSFILDKTLVTSGESAQRDVTVSLFTSAINATHSGWNLVGNPYLSKFDGNGVGETYITKFNGSSYDQYENTDAAIDNLYPFESFFIQASSTSLTFNPNNRQLLPKSVANNGSDRIKIQLTTTTGIDKTNLILDDTQNTGYEVGKDLVKWITTGTDQPQLYTNLGGVNFAYNALRAQDVQNLDLCVYSKSECEATIGIAASQATGLNQLLLTDQMTGNVTDLLTSDYHFLSTAGTSSNRFKISAVESVVTKNSPNRVDTFLYYTKNNYLYLQNLSQHSIVKLYDLLGKVRLSTESSSDVLQIPLEKGIYILQVNNNGISTTQRVIIK